MIISVEEKPEFLEVSVANTAGDYSFVAAKLVQGGYRLTLFKEEEVNLETAFMRLTKGIVQ